MGRELKEYAFGIKMVIYVFTQFQKGNYGTRLTMVGTNLTNKKYVQNRKIKR